MDKTITSVIKTSNYNRTCDWFKCKQLIGKGEEYHDITLGRNTKLSVHKDCYDDFYNNTDNHTAHNQF
jgi:hypothetical protein